MPELELSRPERLPIPRGRDGFIVRYAPGWGRRHPRHRHRELELNLVVKGRGVYVIGDERFDLAAGSLVWLPPQRDHVLVDQTHDFAMWIAAFTPRLLRRVEVEPARATVPPCRLLRAKAAQQLGGLCDSLEGADDDLLNAGLLFLLLAARRAFAAATAGPPRVVHPAVRHAAKLVVRDPKLSGEELARGCGVSAARLSRLFKAEMDVPLAEFRNRVRVDRFLQLASAPGDRARNHLQTAFDAGFGSYAQFFRVFRERLGMTPREYFRRRER